MCKSLLKEPTDVLRNMDAFEEAVLFVDTSPPTWKVLLANSAAAEKLGAPPTDLAGTEYSFPLEHLRAFRFSYDDNQDEQCATHVNVLIAIAGEDFWDLFHTDSRSDSVLAHLTYADRIAHGQSFAIHGASVLALAYESSNAVEKLTLNFR